LVTFLAGSAAAQPCPIGDLSGDCTVNLQDLQIFAQQWLDPPGSCPGANIPTAGLAAHWELDEGSGTTAYDSAGSSNGTFHGDPDWVAGKVGSGALDFDGVGDYVQIPDDNSLSPQAYGDATWSLWAKKSTSVDNQNLLGKGYSGNWEYAIREKSTGEKIELVIWLKHGAGSHMSLITDASIGLNTWCHIAFVYVNGTSLTGYINGQPSGSSTSVTGTTGNGNEPLRIANRRSTDISFDGIIDDVRIYNRALLAGEVWQLYQDGL
jgi:hypothetical protein